MAVYRMDRDSLAEYLSETKIFMDFGKYVESTTGYRCDIRSGASYPISVKEIKADTIIPDIDCFIEDGCIQAIAHIPEIKFKAITNELGKAYSKGSTLAFEFRVAPFEVEYCTTNIPKSIGNFVLAMDNFVSDIQEEINEYINDFIRAEKNDWSFRGISVDCSFDVHYKN